MSGEELSFDEYDEIVNTAIKQIYRDNECRALQKIIEKQQKEIEELKEKYGELFIKYEMKKILFIRKDHASNKLKEELYIRKDTLNDDYISKDKIRDKIERFKITKKEIFKLEHELGRASITYDIVRNDYCEKMLEELLKE